MEKTVLVIGGAFQDKLNAALAFSHLTMEDVGENPCENKKIINNFQNYFKNNMNDEGLLEKCRGKIVIADEIGCGIIPLEKSDRIYREALGRFLCDLAAISDTVIRVTCGIPTFIKGE